MASRSAVTIGLLLHFIPMPTPAGQALVTEDKTVFLKPHSLSAGRQT